jgi:pyruvate dehydrogenase E1 component alpha subunit
MSGINYKKYKNFSSKLMLELYSKMLLIRLASEEIREASLKMELKCPVHFSIGQEATAVGLCANLKKEDFLVATHRPHSAYLAKGGGLKQMMAEIYNREGGCAGGRGGSMHLVSPGNNFFSTAIVGGGIPIATGFALSMKLQQKRFISVSFFGDGAVEEGVFHESLNFAALKKLPIIFFCENNFYAVQSKIEETQSDVNIFKKAFGYNMPGFRVDGNNVLEVFTAAKEAIKSVRQGNGPVLIEAETYRWLEHVGPGQSDSRPKGEVERWKNRCPLNNFEEFLIEISAIDRDDIGLLRQKTKKQVLAARKQASALRPISMKLLRS